MRDNTFADVDPPRPLTVELRRFECPATDPFDAFIRLRAELGEQELFLLESLSGPAVDNTRALIGMIPLLDIVVHDGDLELSGDDDAVAWALSWMAEFGGVSRTGDRGFRLDDRAGLWDALRHLQSGFDVEGLDDGRFGFGFMTLLSYDAVTYIESLPRVIPKTNSVPDAVFRLYASVIEVDLLTGTSELTVATCGKWRRIDPEFLRTTVVKTLSDTALMSTAGPDQGARFGAGAPGAPVGGAAPEMSMTPAAYADRVDRALDHIRAGDIYQVQIGHEVRMSGERRDLDVYLRMRDYNPSPYMAFIPYLDMTVLSASPELHVRIDGSGLTMRPIAGTVRRGADPAEDAEHAAWLRGDPKEKAEHIMLVDLCRNDLGRVAVPGSVRVEDLMNVETYSHVLHLVSTVTARLDGAADVYDVVRATFPAGTMTGAPKLRAMEIIESLELSRRDMYAGAFGVIGFGGFANLALSIRTIVATGDTYAARASAGVVADSSTDGEWLETLAKLSSSIVAVSGSEL